MRSSIVAVGAALFASSVTANAQDVYRPATGTLLQIEAEGSIRAAPDVMSVEASVVTAGETAAEALDRSNGLTARLIEAVKASKIQIANLQTADLNVEARFDDEENGPPRILGYIARNSLQIELADVVQAGDLISLLFDAGGNEISGPYFTLRDPTPAQRKAERAAVLKAREEAENYAAALGMKVSRVLRVFDRKFDDKGGGRTIVITASRLRSTPIEPGEITYTATIHVEYLLEPL